MQVYPEHEPNVSAASHYCTWAGCHLADLDCFRLFAITLTDNVITRFAHNLPLLDALTAT